MRRGAQRPTSGWRRFQSATAASQTARSRVTWKHADEAYGQAHWWLPESQLPQAPPPAEPHGPQELPQQNQLISPVAGDRGFTAIEFSIHIYLVG